jgi:hypothetical protein
MTRGETDKRARVRGNDELAGCDAQGALIPQGEGGRHAIDRAPVTRELRQGQTPEFLWVKPLAAMPVLPRGLRQPR